MNLVIFLSQVFLITLGGMSTGSAEAEPPDYLIAAYTGGAATASLPRTSYLRDHKNQTILRACIVGANLKELTELEVDSLEQRLERMCRGRILIREGSNYRPALPVLVGTGRELLDSMANGYAERLSGTVRSLLEEMRFCRDIEPDERFHLLWSLIMDQCWHSIWSQLRPTETGPPQVVWIVDPPHEYAVGTNFWQLPGGSIVAATWSPNCSEHLDSLMPMRLDLLRAAWQMPLKDSTGEALLTKYGFLSDNRVYLGLKYQDSAGFASQQEIWRDTYSREVARSLDLKTAATSLALPEGQTFVILLHEIAYALFEHLTDSHDLEFPLLLKTGRPIDRTVNLVSIRLARRPLPEDEIAALFMANDYHGSDKIVDRIVGFLATNPDNIDVRLILGMSLYDLKRYDEAIVAFQELSVWVAGDSKAEPLYDWSRVWIGHVYDAKGERAEALKWYRDVESDGSMESIMSFGQYRIGPVDAVTWARDRIITPFIWP